MKKVIALLLTFSFLLSFMTAVSANSGELIEFSPDWNITASTESGNEPVGYAFDGDASTYWHTHFVYANGKVQETAPYPHVVTVTFPEKRNVSGWRYTPRTDLVAGVMHKYEIYASSDGESFNLIYEGDAKEYASGNDASIFTPISASWGNVSMKAIKIVITEGRGGHGTAAEIEFFENGEGIAIENGKAFGAGEVDGVKIPFENSWQIEASSETSAEPPMNAFDGNKSTFWHTHFVYANGKVQETAPYPHTLTVTFPTVKKLGGFRYVPRTDLIAGVMTKYEIHASTDGVNFNLIHKGEASQYAKGNSASGFMPLTATWESVDVKAVRFVITEGRNGHGTAAEIEFYESINIAEEPKTEDFEGEEGKNSSKGIISEKTAGTSRKGRKFLSRDGWKVSVSSDVGETVYEMFDGKNDTYWHSHFTTDMGRVTEHETAPYYISIILPETEEISGLTILPRQDRNLGSFTKINLYVKENDEDEWFLLKENLPCSGSMTLNEFYFASNIKAKRIRIEADTVGYGTVAELNIMGKDETIPSLSYAEFSANEEAKLPHKIDSSSFTAYSASKSWSGNTPANIFDGTVEVMWQTESLPANEVVILTVDLGDVYTVTGIDAIPRETNDLHGAWLGVNVSASKDDFDWSVVKEKATFGKNLDVREFSFEEPVMARYFEFEIYDYNEKRVSLGELIFYESKEAKEEREKAKKERYGLTIDSKEITYKTKDGEGKKEIDVAPFIINGSTMIPLRGLLELMGAEITWYGEDQSIDIAAGEYFIHLQIDNQLVYVKHPEYGDIRYTLLSAPVIVSGRTFIPIRFVSEQLGYNVIWNGETREITIEN